MGIALINKPNISFPKDLKFLSPGKQKENKETSMVWEPEPEVWIQLRPITTHYTECEESYYLATHQTVFNSNLPESKRKVRRI